MASLEKYRWFSDVTNLDHAFRGYLCDAIGSCSRRRDNMLPAQELVVLRIEPNVILVNVSI